jgi:hypothetical protein
VDVFGPPTLIPGSATLSAGQSLDVSVRTDGVLDVCYATTSDVGVFTVSSGEQSLLGTPVSATALETNEVYGFKVGVIEGATQAATATVTCEDVYGQVVDHVTTFAGAEPAVP